MAAATSLLVSGPTWSDAGSTTYPGRFPLSVERHVMSMVDRLVPGVTTATLNTRYYALHGLVAAEARRKDLSEPEAVDLMRRAEVVIGAVSARHLRLHEDAHRALRRPHGMELIAPKVDGGIDIGALAVPKAYAQPKWGFSTAYHADEPQLRRCAQGSFTEAAAMHFSCTSGTPFVYFSCTGIDGCGLDGQRGR